MRRLGVYGANLPTKKERSVEPADFSIAGLIGYFDRKYKTPIKVTSDIEAKTIFGIQTNPNYYGWDCLNGFLKNLRGQSASIYILSICPNDATIASATIRNADNGKQIIVAKASYVGQDQYGASGNNIALSVTNGVIFTSKCTEFNIGTTNVIRTYTVSGVHTGDIVRLKYIGASTGSDIYGVASAVAQGFKSITLTEATADLTGLTASDYQIEVCGFKIQTFIRDLNGNYAEVDKTLGETWCTVNSTDSDRYFVEIFKNSSYVSLKGFWNTDVTPDKRLPKDTNKNLLTGGVDGTPLANTTSDWESMFSTFNNLPIRMLANAETTNNTISNSMIQYCENREDNPIAIVQGVYGIIDKGQACAIGEYFQLATERDCMVLANWLGVANPFNTSPVAPDREVPAVGHIMGLWIYSIMINGIHSSPARKNCPILGVNNVLGYNALDDLDRTILAQSGINVIQKLKGKGFILRNAFTSSTLPEFRYANAVIERNFIKISCVDSLQDSENTPNTIANVREDRMAVLQFMNKLWRSGSNGSTKEGETFGQYEKEDGSLSTTEDAFEVIADASNNSVATLQMGERNIDIWFMFPAPAGSIKVGVGLIYKTLA